MSVTNAIEGGMDTARLSAAAQDQLHREQRKTDALAYLTRSGNLDVAEILGLIPSAPPRREPRSRVGGTPKAVKQDGTPESRRKGCPSEAQYRRHREQDEDCPTCHAHVSPIWAARKQRRKQQAAAS